jgi:hypothetical protein
MLGVSMGLWDIIMNAAFIFALKKMELLQGTELIIPLSHLILFMLLVVVCLLFAKYKIGLALAFSFMFYWAFIYNRETIFSYFGGSTFFLFLYCFSGLILVLFVFCAVVIQD